VALEELQALLIELLDLLIERCVCASLEDQDLTVANLALDAIRKAGGSQGIMAPECYLRWRLNPAKLRFHIVCDHRI
jgi:hypothetical protein